MNSLRLDDAGKNISKLVRTGYRMIKILELLIEKPCSCQEINEEFQRDIHLKKEVSDDMICMYINSLRKIGCDISRPSKSNSFCYKLNSHPFAFKISKKDSKMLEEVLKNLIKSNNWQLLIEVCEFFKEIKNFCAKDSDMNFLRTISTFLKIDFDLVKKLNYFCEKEKFIVLEYQSPNSGLKEIGLYARNISLENSKLYLWGYSLELNELQYLRLDRIKEIKIIGFKENNIKAKKITKTVYKLLNMEDFSPDENQKIIQNTGKEILIEEEIENRFKFVQKVLSYGSKCIVLEPQDIRTEIVSTIERMLGIYG